MSFRMKFSIRRSFWLRVFRLQLLLSPNFFERLKPLFMEMEKQMLFG